MLDSTFAPTAAIHHMMLSISSFPGSSNDTDTVGFMEQTNGRHPGTHISRQEDQTEMNQTEMNQTERRTTLTLLQSAMHRNVRESNDRETTVPSSYDRWNGLKRHGRVEKSKEYNSFRSLHDILSYR